MKRIVLLRFGTTPVARVCSGVAPLIIPNDPLDGLAYKFLGGGKLVEVPQLEQVINGTAQRISITVSGVSKATVAMFRDESSQLKGAPVHVGVAKQDDDWQIKSVEWYAELRCDAPSMDLSHASRSITLSIGSSDTDRSHAPAAFWTTADQARKSPTDRFFDYVSALSSGTPRRFGPSDA